MRCWDMRNCALEFTNYNHKFDAVLNSTSGISEAWSQSREEEENEEEEKLKRMEEEKMRRQGLYKGMISDSYERYLAQVGILAEGSIFILNLNLFQHRSPSRSKKERGRSLCPKIPSARTDIITSIWGRVSKSREVTRN